MPKRQARSKSSPKPNRFPHAYASVGHPPDAVPTYLLADVVTGRLLAIEGPLAALVDRRTQSNTLTAAQVAAGNFGPVSEHLRQSGNRIDRLPTHLGSEPYLIYQESGKGGLHGGNVFLAVGNAFHRVRRATMAERKALTRQIDAAWARRYAPAKAARPSR